MLGECFGSVSSYTPKHVRHNEDGGCVPCARVCPVAGLQLPPAMPVLYEQQGGILEPEKMIAAHVKVAQHHGAHVATQEVVQGWSVLPDGLVEVETDKATHRAERLVLSAGAWMDQLVPELQVNSTVQGDPGITQCDFWWLVARWKSGRDRQGLQAGSDSAEGAFLLFKWNRCCRFGNSLQVVKSATVLPNKALRGIQPESTGY